MLGTLTVDDMDGRLREGHFFAGGGGGVLASEVLGHEPVFAIERDERRCRILRESGWFPGMHVECADIRGFDFAPWAGRMDCIAAGFPCQDISSAGPGAGLDGERSGLFFYLVEAIDVIRPSLVFLENSPDIRTRGRDVVIRCLVERGYSWRDGTLAASDVGAGHRRDRWWCLAANADGLGKLEQERDLGAVWEWDRDGVGDVADVDGVGRTEGGAGPAAREGRPHSVVCASSSSDAGGVGGPERGTEQAEREGWGPDVDGGSCSSSEVWSEFACGLERAVDLGGLCRADAEAIAVAGAYTGRWNWSSPGCGVCRVVDGLADRVDRVATCGEGQVPLAAAVAWILLRDGF